MIGRDTNQPRSAATVELLGHPVYKDRCIVEYFSWRRSCWLLGVVSLDALCTGKHKEKLVSVVYNVTLCGTRQQRYDVNLHLLRRPPSRGELVEVQTHAHRGWLSGRVVRVKWSPTGRLYIVLLDVLDLIAGTEVSVPGSDLRRRFPVESKVLVYGDHTVGWRPGTIVDITSPPVVVKSFRRHIFSGRMPPDSAPDHRCFSVLVEGCVGTVPAHSIDCLRDVGDVV